MSALKSISYTQSWGLNAGTGQMVLLGGGAAAGTEFAVSIGGLTISGVVMKSVESADSSGGSRFQIDFADNRIRLTWDHIECLYNRCEVLAVRPEAPQTASRRRRYWHIHPDDWKTGKRTYTPNPMTVREILQKVFGSDSIKGGGSSIGSGVNFTSGGAVNPGIDLRTPSLLNNPSVLSAYNSNAAASGSAGSGWRWSFDSHPNLDRVVYDVDAMNGMELGNFIQMLGEKVGLVMRLSGRSRIGFAVKGEGAVPLIPGPDRKQLSVGSALSQNKTHVTVIGDRNLYQDTNIVLEPDWSRGWEAYLFEGAFTQMVGSAFDVPGDTASGRASRSAKARQVTVKEVADKLARPDLLDGARWAETTRNHLPAWFYVNDIVWKSYRIPRAYKLNGLTLDMLEIKEGLLFEVKYTDGLKEPIDYVGNAYPDMKAMIVAKGQALNIYDPSKREFVNPATYTTLRGRYRPIPNFKIDCKNWSVLFDEPVVDPGEGSEGMFLWVNAGRPHVPEDHPSKNLVTPNQNAVFTEPSVVASFCFEAERYSKAFGAGIRRSSAYVSGLCRHVILDTGKFREELDYATEPPEGADAKADEAVVAYLTKRQTYMSGGYQRLGGFGMTLSGVVDRVSFSMDANSGMKEDVEFTKERGPNYFDSERELERRRSVEELFPGQRELRQEAQDYTYWGRVVDSADRGTTAGTYRNLNDVIRKPIGNENAGVTQVFVGASYAAGDVLWRDADNNVSQDGDGFAGVVVAEGNGLAPSPTTVATQGVVPVNCLAPFAAGDPMYCAEDETTCKPGEHDTRRVGTVMESCSGEGIMLVPVMLNTRSGDKRGFEVTVLESGKVWVKASTLLGKVPDNMDINDITRLELDPPAGVSGAWNVYGKVVFSQGNTGVIAERVIMASIYPPWSPASERDPYTFYEKIASMSTSGGETTRQEQNRLGPIDWFLENLPRPTPLEGEEDDALSVPLLPEPGWNGTMLRQLKSKSDTLLIEVDPDHDEYVLFTFFGNSHPLKIIPLANNQIQVLDGTCAGDWADDDMDAGDWIADVINLDGDDRTYVYCEFSVTQSGNSGIWSAFDRDIIFSDTTKDNTNSKSYILIGRVKKTGSGTKPIVLLQEASGSQDWERAGFPDDFKDKNWLH